MTRRTVRKRLTDMVAMSPRNPPPRLRSTSVEEGSDPKRSSSHYERIALRRGYTIKAGKKTRNRVANSETVTVRPLRKVIEVTDNAPTDEHSNDPSPSPNP